MAKIFSVTPLELRPGVSGEDFVRFWIEEYAPLGLRRTSRRLVRKR